MSVSVQFLGRTASRAVGYAVVYAAALLTLAPFIWMVLTSFKDLGEIFS